MSIIKGKPTRKASDNTMISFSGTIELFYGLMRISYDEKNVLIESRTNYSFYSSVEDYIAPSG